MFVTLYQNEYVMSKDEELHLEKIIIKKPDHPCTNCGCNEYYQNSQGQYICKWCHPPVSIE